MSEFRIHHHVCRECRKIKQVADIRGWSVCLECIESIDRQFTSERADYFFKNDKLERTIAMQANVIAATDALQMWSKTYLPDILDQVEAQGDLRFLDQIKQLHTCMNLLNKALDAQGGDTSPEKDGAG